MACGSGTIRDGRKPAAAAAALFCGCLLVGPGVRAAAAHAPACAVAPMHGGAFPAAPDFSAVSSASAADAWAVGTYPVKGLAGIAAIADHWDGRRWHVVYPPVLQQAATGLNGVAARTPSDVWAVGFGGLGTLVEHWNGAAWSIVPSPHIGGQQNINDFEAVAAFAPGLAFAVGHTGYQQSGMPLVERWNGSAWSVVTTPASVHGGLYGISGSGAADVWTVGSNGAGGPLVLRLNAAGWQRFVVPVPPGTKYASFVGVLDRAPGDVWAVGGFTPDGSIYHNLIEHWNGSAWSIVAAPDAPWVQSQGLEAVAAISANDVWAVGAGPVTLHWDGSAWSAIGASGQFPAGASFSGAAASGAQTLIVGGETNEPVHQLFAVGGCR